MFCVPIVAMEIALLLILCSFSGNLLVLAQTSLTDNDRRELLNAHNRFRRIVSPSASNMIKLVKSFMLDLDHMLHCNARDMYTFATHITV